jgi:hypothetical protein
MASIVGAFSTPHNPFLPTRVPNEPDGVDAHGFAAVGEALRSVRADVLVAFSPDHFNTFFYDNLPQIAVGVVDWFEGPLDPPPNVPHRRVRSDPELAGYIFDATINSDFDPARANKLDVDHSLIVQLQLTARDVEPVVVPIILNVFAPPILPTQRACEFGRAVGAAIRSFPAESRVALLANGGINQEVGGPRVRPGGLDGTPDPEWHAHVVDRLRQGELEQLRAEATSARMLQAGNAAGELLTVLAMLHALGGSAVPRQLIPEPVIGHCYGIWIPE